MRPSERRALEAEKRAEKEALEREKALEKQANDAHRHSRSEVGTESKTEDRSERINTDAEYLQGAMDEADGLTYEYTDGPYGASVHTVNGLRADYTLDGAYWAFYINGDYCNYGISEQPVADGDAFRIEYTPA